MSDSYGKLITQTSGIVIFAWFFWLFLPLGFPSVLVILLSLIVLTARRKYPSRTRLFSGLSIGLLLWPFVMALIISLLQNILRVTLIPYDFLNTLTDFQFFTGDFYRLIGPLLYGPYP